MVSSSRAFWRRASSAGDSGGTWPSGGCVIMSVSDDLNLNALKDTYDHSCFFARLEEDRHVMADSPGAGGTAPGAGVSKAPCASYGAPSDIS